MQQARKFLYDNQECFVAQWVIQNPYADINNYRLKFVYNDQSLLGYTVEMEKIDV
ncbi:portal protein [Pseudomonas phage phiPto-bp6g]|nr:portal protein [Pseudomonas phage phiPto-bp6g]